jgi:tRNA pseudouridine55 synthase
VTPHGVLVVDKPVGPTSHDVVAVARRVLGIQRIGHTGTLDPLASGVLVLVVGSATRLARFMAHDVKAYDAEVTFGRATQTYDAQGETTLETGRAPSRDALEEHLTRRLGPQTQVPPVYSAKKIGGEAAHRVARRQLAVTLRPVAVTVHAIELRAYEAGVASLRLRVSAGFYVRSLAHDLGVVFDTGGHLSALRRTAVGPFTVAQAISLETLARGGQPPRAAIVPLDRLLPDMAAVAITDDDVRRARQGQQVPGVGQAVPAEGPVRLVDPAGRLVGIAEPRPVAAGSGSCRLLQPLVVVG